MNLLGRAIVIGCGAALAAGSMLARAQSPAVVSQAPAAARQGPAASSQTPVDYERDIQPIFEQHCAECHGRTKSRARLRLHDPAFIRRGGQSGPAIAPGDSHGSLMIRRILDVSEDDRMPLDADPLPEATVAILRAWIDQGAPMPGAMAAAPVEEHWAYVKPSRPELPAVANAAWARNEIDRFVLARLEQEKLAPSAEAAKSTLLRRVTLDLTGLPPTPEELDAYIGDTSAGAYEKAVDRLLASPHYGERWARPWLDLARYADTNGYEKDNRRAIWKYRDWVIGALNRDMPFDQFTIEQIAGDMLPEATVEQKIASGFHRNAMTNEEGGVDPDESRYEMLVDRVNTTATVWLGSTLACAQCHNL
jgi:mono/diheme cytochrome c family protein